MIASDLHSLIDSGISHWRPIRAVEEEVKIEAVQHNGHPCFVISRGKYEFSQMYFNFFVDHDRSSWVNKACFAHKFSTSKEAEEALTALRARNRKRQLAKKQAGV